MSSFASLSLYEQAVMLLAALVLFSSFVLLAQTRMLSMIHVFAWQGVLLSVTTALVALVSGQHHLYISALLTFCLKALLIPWMLHRLIIRLGIQSEVESLVGPALVMMAGAALVMFSYWVALPIVQISTLITRNTIAVSLAVVLLGC